MSKQKVRFQDMEYMYSFYNKVEAMSMATRLRESKKYDLVRIFKRESKHTTEHLEQFNVYVF